jgi:hypothetical protein
VVLDDAFNFLQDHDLIGKHATSVSVPTSQHMIPVENFADVSDPRNDVASPHFKRLFVLSAPDEKGLKRLVEVYRSILPHDCSPGYLAALAYTLYEKRTQFPWRYCLAAGSSEELKQSLSIERKFSRSHQLPKLCFVFTGQGAQWHAMGRELLDFSTFRDTLHEFDNELQKLGCHWSVIGKSALDILCKITPADLFQRNYREMRPPQKSTILLTASQSAQHSRLRLYNNLKFGLSSPMWWLVIPLAKLPPHIVSAPCLSALPAK